ncbi:cytochrome c biogenesis CcdA family protein [Methylotenera sp.]|jgi:cytochrome c biogenesis protein CcdA|uniref:cytochrome c biogenesis CcdA family protein n=1 Tax=Methylotenera sp. TaxID=2051956 RepID=UPI002731B850|nr:cytochrome c biogenesis CcdA family protein [Methylotenera sp.]MDP2072521.1 cytochrome c biogenesis CcdA family protein [Methylotenera sp.]MDP2230817.1 cytochrome c biogenesis CcdA family protein [Methylotenera sp.]MDP3005990.1 cytochrome c biogenesis CcdA family protein [Methylotenera sp.]
MIASFGVYGLSLLAGVLSILSPCVLPLVPILVGTALNTHRYGPYALALGLAISFTAVGVFIATIGASIGIDQEVFRVIAAVLLITFGIVLLSSTLQEKFASATAGIGGSGNTLLSKVSTDSLSGQFVLGLLLGIVWSPCVGPVLGATITLASQGANLAHVTLVMALFGLGAGLPLILLGLLSRQAMMRVRSKLFTVGKIGKRILGAILLLVGLLIITGLDKQFETLIVAASPDWLISLTTRY